LFTDVRHRYSKPLSTCRELALSVLKHLPSSSSSSLINESTLPKLVHLVEDSFYSVQKVAYALLKEAAKKRTEHFVIEVGANLGGDEANVVKSVFPLELLEILRKEVDFEWSGDGEQVNVFGYLLGWMIVFDSFVDVVRTLG
jgi:hypothetical protein